MSKKIQTLKNNRYIQFSIMAIVVIVVAIVGIKNLNNSQASSPYVTVQANTGQLVSPASLVTSSGASTGSYVQFGTQTVTGNSLCGFKTTTPAVSKVMIIWEENESTSSIVGNGSLPYMNSLMTSCGLTTNYTSYTHPSLPNYMAMTSGVSYASGPWNGDCLPSASGCTTSNASVFSQLGTNWKGYAESMSGNCDQNPAGSTDSDGNQVYAPRHNPAVYYTNISSNCANQDVPLGSTTSGALYSDVSAGTLPALSTVTPNLSDDWHDGSASQADNWLKGWIPVITAGSDYQSGKLAILIIFDEGAGSGNSTSSTIGIWMSAYTKPDTKGGTATDDYSVTKTVEDLLGLPELSNAQSVNSFTSDFNL